MLVGLLTLYLISFDYCECWDLNLVHINDIHVRMEETNKHSRACRQWEYLNIIIKHIYNLIINVFSDAEKQKKKCFGGVARLQTAINNLKSSEENVLWLNAGDFYQVFL